MQEIVLAQAAAEQQEDACRKQETDRCTQLREHAVPGALARRCVFGGQQHRPTPLASQAQTLAEAAQGQQRRRPQADLRVGRQQADGDRGQAHGQQCSYQCGLAADTVTEVAEHRRADRACDEGHREGRQGLQQCGLVAAFREEQVREHQHRGGGVDVEVEELDGGADQTGQQDTAGRIHGWRGSGDRRHRQGG
ncbi:hypothetical protein D3C73_947130 [compost metagenome]